MPLSVSLALASDTVSVDSAIPLTVTLRNRGDTTLTVARPAIVPNLVYLEVTRDDGEEVPFDGPWLTLRPLRQDGAGRLRLTWVITQLGTYSAIGTVGGAPISAQVEVR